MVRSYINARRFAGERQNADAPRAVKAYLGPGLQEKQKMEGTDIAVPVGSIYVHSEQPQHSYAMPLDTIYLTRHGVCALCTRCGGKAECRCAEGGESIPRSRSTREAENGGYRPRYAFTALGASAFCLSPATSPSRKHICT
jgi:hypothetical protein